MNYRVPGVLLLAGLLLVSLTGIQSSAENAFPLKRQVAAKPSYKSLPQGMKTDEIIFKIKEGIGQPEFDGESFVRTGAEWSLLNEAISPANKTVSVERHITVEESTLEQMRAIGSQRAGIELPDLTLYYRLILDGPLTDQERLDRVALLNSLDIIEIAYFAPKPVLPIMPRVFTPSFEFGQYYLQPAPTGINAYYAWSYSGGRGEGVKVIDIEGNWVESHEDLHGGTDHFHIAGAKIQDPTWYNHGTAVLGEIAADSNLFGMTGIAFNVDLGTVSIGSMSTSDAITTASNNADTGDIILIELQTGGPNGGAYVPVEYYQDSFDAILTASALGRIVVEAGANGAQDLDDEFWYGSLFDPDYRFSGAIMVAASYNDHVPAPFTSHGQRLDVHAFGTWDVYTLGYGGLYGSDTTDYYTSSFSGTSSASPIIVGASAILQGIHKSVHSRVLDHNGMRTLLQAYSTPQAPHSWLIGPLPDLQGSIDEVVGVAFFADTTIGWVPFDVNYTATSGLQVDTWAWDFFDGDSAFVQSPSHTYTIPGMFDVSVEIDADGDIRYSQKDNYIVALADSMIAPDTGLLPGETIEVPIYARNITPLTSIIIPVEYSGVLNLTLDSFSTAGCRTDYFELQNYIHADANNKRKTIKLQSSASGGAPELSPGTGCIVKLYLRLAAGATPGDSAIIGLDGYSFYTPEFNGSVLNYEPVAQSGSIYACAHRGNMDGEEGITVSDVTFLVDYLFKGGPAPDPLESSDVNCDDETTVVDLSHLVDYLFRFGPPPCGC